METFDLRHAALWYATFLFSTVCHEAAHAWAGRRLGDATAERWITLDPRPHLRRTPFGMIAVPWMIYFLTHCQWMLGYASVPCDARWARVCPRRAALMALAGPLANLCLFLVFAGVARAFAACAPGWGAAPGFVASFQKALEVPVVLNLLYAAFNLMPLPPLDGASLPSLFLPRSWATSWQDLVASPSLAFGGLLGAWMLFDRYFEAIWAPLLRLAF